MNKTVRILSISVAAAAAAFLSGCSSVDMGPATVVDHSTYSDGAATAPVQTPSLLPGGIVDSGRTHTVAVGDTIYNISVRYGLSAEQLQQLNAITDPTQLRLGQVLRLPASVNAPRAYTGNPQVRVNRVTNDTVLETAPIRNAETVPAAGETTATSSAASADAAEAARKKAEAEAAAEKVRTQAEAAKSQAQQKLNAVTPGQRMIWPVRGKIKSDFAKNTFGLEIAGTQGDVVVAAMQGEVIWVGTLKGYSGTLAVVKHSPTLITAYGGLENVAVSQGSKIKSGQKIADLKGDTLVRGPRDRQVRRSAQVPQQALILGESVKKERRLHRQALFFLVKSPT